jgi:Cu-Zn family superoxide dismutase
MNIYNKPISAIAVFQSNKPGLNNVNGTVVFKESSRSDNIIITVDLHGLKPGKHGFHIHETGNLLDNCDSCKGHFNPHGKTHGGLTSKTRHVGDLGNIVADKNGICNVKITDKSISLRFPKTNIIGRSLVIHADEDDLGQGNNQESLVTGNSGKRIACAVIGYKDVVYF